MKMQKGFLGKIVLAGLMFAAISVVGCSSSEKQSSKAATASDGKNYTFKLAHVNNPNHPYTLASKKFAELVNKSTNGHVTVEVYDNGVLCTCEQSIIYPQEKKDELVAALKANGAYYVDNENDAQKLRDCIFPFGKLNKACVGESAAQIGKMAGIPVPEGTKVIVSITKGIGKDDVLAKEKLFPVMALFPYDKWEDAVEIARTNLEMEGIGHSVVIHSNTKEHVEYVPTRVNVSRYAVNQVGGTALGGALDNYLHPTTTLGCGTWGNNSISENLWYYNLMNVSRIAYRLTDAKIPTDEEIWAE